MHTNTFLPGLDEAICLKDCRPADIDMSDESKFTAGVLLRDHPDIFQAVAKMLFKYRVGERMTADILRVSVNTVRAIRDMAASNEKDACAAAFFIKSRAATSRQILALNLIEKISDKLNSPDELKKISIDTLVAALKAIDSNSATQESTKDDPIEVDSISQFDEVINGLDLEKKSGRKNDEISPSKMFHKEPYNLKNSIEHSADSQYFQGSNDNLCKNLENPINSAQKSHSDQDVATGADRPNIGGEGVPTGANERGLD